MKIIIFIILLLTVILNCFCQEYYANRDEILYENFNPAFGSIREINKGEKLYIIEGGVSWGVFETDVQRKKIKTKDGLDGYIAIDAISVSNSDELPSEITDFIWIHSYYLDVLKNGYREKLFDYESFWSDDFNKYNDSFGMHRGDKKYWYEIAWQLSRFEFYTIYIKMGELAGNNSYDLFNGIIYSNNNIYSFESFCTINLITFKENKLENYFPINKKNIITLHLDGDYLDVYKNENLIFSLIKLKDEISNQYKNLMLNNKGDVSNIVLPKRAENSKGHIPISEIIDNYNQMVNDQKIQLAVKKMSIHKNNGNNSLPLLIAIIGGVLLVVSGIVRVSLLLRRWQ